MQNGVPRTIAVIIVYQPCIAVLAKLVLSILPQVEQTCLVLNQAPPDLLHQLQECGVSTASIATIHMPCNVGVATAQNAGIRYAIQEKFHRILLLDQDSFPASDMVFELGSALTEAPLAAAVGPCYVDPRQDNPSPFLRCEGLRLRRLCRDDGPVVPVDYLISSGCLISLAALSQIGEMRDDLFIDYIDIEWGLRAKAKGFLSYGVFAARMEHALGEDPIRLFGRSISLHSPLRNYYLVRNAVLLYREKWIPLNWKLIDGWRLTRRFIFYLFFGGEFFQRLRMMLLGLAHALSGRAGSIR